MTEPKELPYGFPGLIASRTSRSDLMINGKQDFDHLCPSNVERQGVIDATSDVSTPDECRMTTDTQSITGVLKRRNSTCEKNPAKLDWSAETWSQIKLDVVPSEPFAFLFSKNEEKKAVCEKPPFEDTVPYTKSELLEVLNMFQNAPTSASEIKSAYESRRDIAEGRFVFEKCPARHTKGGSSMVIDENYLYSFIQPQNLGGPHKMERAETLKNLENLLTRIAHANLQNTPPDTLKKRLLKDDAAQKLRSEQAIRSVEGFNELVYLIKARYDKAYETVLRAKKHEENEFYYHPKDRLTKGGHEESVRKQLRTFTEVNVNSWAESDPQDPTIVRSNKGIRILANDDPDLPFDEREELKLLGPSAQADEPDFEGIGEARLSMAKRDKILKNSNRDWELYLESQIAALGEEYLAGGDFTVRFNDRVFLLLFKLKEDPEEATSAFFEKKGMHNIKREEFNHVLNIIEFHLENDRNTPGSAYYRLFHFKKDLALRKLRSGIISRINANQWYFVLQKIPPIELKPNMTHCAHPYCNYHESDLMPAVGYRLVFMNDDHSGQPTYWYDEVGENTRTPGCTEDGQMLFCLACVENLFNGVGFIQADRPSTGFLDASQPQPPNIKPVRIAPGLDIFAATLHTFIRPELRYTWHEFYTLNSFEYHAFMKWKNMCIRKTMWEIPRKRTFNLQIPDQAAYYDIVDFFGDDCLDMNEPRPSIVTGISLNMGEVCADDLSIAKYQESVSTDVVKKVIGVKRKALHPLSNVTHVEGIDKSDLRYLFKETFLGRINGTRVRVVKPLSEIMILVDQRVQKAWAAMIPPYVPRKSRIAPNPADREWPPPAVWESELRNEGEMEGARDTNFQEEIDQKYATISQPLQGGRLQDQQQTPHSNSRKRTLKIKADSRLDRPSLMNGRGRIGKCVTCGTTESPDWRNGPDGHNTLCNACGIRYFRKQRRLVPPPA